MTISDIDKRRMKELCKYLHKFEPYYDQIYKSSILCFDQDKPKMFKEARYKSLFDAFLSGEEVVVFIHDRGWHTNKNCLFLDMVERPVFQYKDNYERYLLEEINDMLFITIQSTLEIKRSGVVTKTASVDYKLKKEHLHSDIYMAIEELLEDIKNRVS